MGRFASTAEFYEQFRQPYPHQFFGAVAQTLKLSKQHTLLDIGTGPGLLAIGFAPYAGDVTAIDPEPAMLAAAREAMARAGRTVHLVEGRAEDLPADAGPFDVVTIGRALHWIDREAMGPLFLRLLKPGGALVICGSSSARDARNPWLEPYNTARAAWSDPAMWQESGKGERTHRQLTALMDHAGFKAADVVRLETVHEVAVNHLAQRILTFSPSSPAALGDKVDAMLADVEAILAPFSHDGLITETVVSRADIARR
ncbi:MAG TPA: class I SAM-dependent methyltransferase [Bradyrhizobium sp.]|uniref:class I SAM-dependent methyltransferase n=1 Tax=Bradyrhizobium sp. TaxID=376 RepID=UPI002CC41E11|nr:class I SAM-dependent methyltransferase [Bradyrhizobium sp.]HLZ04924.1 class I SAM-dependent methyltransferase [Bradyrhizobium sp.]